MAERSGGGASTSSRGQVDRRGANTAAFDVASVRMPELEVPKDFGIQPFIVDNRPPAPNQIWIERPVD